SLAHVLEALDPQRLFGRGEVAVRCLEGLLAVENPCPGLLAEPLDIRSRDVRHVPISRVVLGRVVLGPVARLWWGAPGVSSCSAIRCAWCVPGSFWSLRLAPEALAPEALAPEGPVPVAGPGVHSVAGPGSSCRAGRGGRAGGAGRWDAVWGFVVWSLA